MANSEVPSANVMGKTFKVCPICKQEKRLWSYHEPKQNVMLDCCKACYRKAQKKAQYDMVMDVLSKLDI